MRSEMGFAAFVAIIGILAIAFVACGSGPREVRTGDMKEVGVSTSGFPIISRWIDHEAGVVCWVYGNGNQGGLSCLPLSETTLEEGSP